MEEKVGLLDRMFGRAASKQKTQTELTHEVAEKIVQDYGAVLMNSAPVPGGVADVCKLPYPKDRIKQALIVALSFSKDVRMREQLKVGYIMLADWQESVGDQTLGIDFTPLDLNSDVAEVFERIVSQGEAMQKWRPLIQAERETLKLELQKLGLW